MVSEEKIDFFPFFKRTKKHFNKADRKRWIEEEMHLKDILNVNKKVMMKQSYKASELKRFFK